jgi:AraC-like DNA-binding protein
MKEKAIVGSHHVQPEQIIKSKGINVHCTDHTDEVIKTYSRKDFYKVCLYIGEAVIAYADRSINIKGITLFFGTPHIPYSWEDIDKEKAYSSLFTEEFLKTNNNSESLQQSPLFKIGGTPVFHLTEAQSKPIIDIFKKMIQVYDADYIYKNDLIRNYINLIIHEALQLQPADNYIRHKNASDRVTSLFLELLERQFPTESPGTPLKLKTARDYAQGLSVHVNHLNHAVKEVTGRPTTAHISERIITEAKALLKHTDWSIAEIGYALGFEYPTYFNNYFKRHTGTTPATFRA